MLGAIIAGAFIGVIILTGVAIAYGELRIDGIPLFTQQEIAPSNQEVQIQNIQELDDLDEKQLEYLEKTLETLEHNEIELTQAEKELLEQIMQMKVKGITQEDIDTMELSLADDLLKMGLNLKPELINSLDG